MARSPLDLARQGAGVMSTIVDKMTNWQRHQWARAGYPGLTRGQIDEAKVKPFLDLQRNRATAQASDQPGSGSNTDVHE